MGGRGIPVAPTPTRDDIRESLAQQMAIREANSWQHHAACRGLDPNLFHPQRGESTKEAKALCRGCPVRVECLAYALDNCERFGVWGGLSERERRVLRSPRREAVA